MQAAKAPVPTRLSEIFEVLQKIWLPFRRFRRLARKNRRLAEFLAAFQSF